MANERPFGFDPDDLDRVIREASEELRGFKDKIVHFVEADAQIPWTGLFADIAARTKRPDPRPETTGDTGDGVWAIYSVDDGGVARVEEVYATELDALRAHKHNTDPRRSVRFLPYGVTVSVLDQPKEDQPKEPPAPAAE